MQIHNILDSYDEIASNLFSNYTFCNVLLMLKQQKKPIVITGYGEVYYGFDFDKPRNNNRPSFIYSHNRHNEVNVNLAMIHAAYKQGRVRANIGLMTGNVCQCKLSCRAWNFAKCV